VANIWPLGGLARDPTNEVAREVVIHQEGVVEARTKIPIQTIVNRILTILNTQPQRDLISSKKAPVTMPEAMEVVDSKAARTLYHLSISVIQIILNIKIPQ
jgi:hypothetical protein